MGGGNSEEIVEETPVVQGNVDDAGTVTQFNEEGVIAKVDNPESATEAQLYKVSKNICQWKDANEYAYRLRQVELLNFTIRFLSRALCKGAENTEEYQKIHTESMQYLNAFQKGDEVHNWEILAKDPLFIPADREETFFSTYEKYFEKNSGASKEIHQDRFDQFLRQFIRLRDRLMQYLGKHCSIPEKSNSSSNDIASAAE